MFLRPFGLYCAFEIYALFIVPNGATFWKLDMFLPLGE
jgi:hypothetical protein